MRRIKDECQTIIQEFALSLNGKNVITECATGPYSLTGPLAALAGADRVLCLGIDSADFGSFEEAQRQTLDAARRFGVAERISCARRTSVTSIADLPGSTIITNLRGVRPVVKDILRLSRGPSVVCTMSELWELRAGDVDLSACHEFGAAVVSTNEEHPGLKSIELVGLLCVQIAAVYKLPLASARIGVIGAGKFARATTQMLLQWNEVECAVDSLALEEMINGLERFDYVVNADHDAAVLTMSSGSLLIERASGLSMPIISLTGLPDGARTDYDLLIPTRRVQPRQMTVALDALGPWPVVRLHAAGLRAGQYVLDVLDRAEDVRPASSFVEEVICGP